MTKVNAGSVRKSSPREDGQPLTRRGWCSLGDPSAAELEGRMGERGAQPLGVMSGLGVDRGLGRGVLGAGAPSPWQRACLAPDWGCGPGVETQRRVQEAGVVGSESMQVSTWKA